MPTNKCRKDKGLRNHQWMLTLMSAILMRNRYIICGDYFENIYQSQGENTNFCSKGIYGTR